MNEATGTAFENVLILVCLFRYIISSVVEVGTMFVRYLRNLWQFCSGDEVKCFEAILF